MTNKKRSSQTGPAPIEQSTTGYGFAPADKKDKSKNKNTKL
ncbi:hypothetical protein [Bacillus sp. FJAT-18017]|nr:hypothetical protein [Bacillus sp. FJAT-18017]